MRTAGFWPPLMLTRPTPGSCEIFCASRVSARSSHLRQRQRLRGQRQREDRRVGRVGLAVDRRVGQVRGRKVPPALIAACTSCSATSMLRSSVNCSVMTERPVGAGRGHLVQPGHLAELALQRRGDGGRHHVRAGAGIERDHLDRRVVDLRQRRDRQLPDRRRRRRAGSPTISSDVATGRRMNGRDGLMTAPSGDPCRRRPCRRRLPPLPRRWPPPARRRRGCGCRSARPPTTSTFMPGRSLSTPSMTTMSPAATPLWITVSSPSVSPTATLRDSTVWSGLTT